MIIPHPIGDFANAIGVGSEVNGWVVESEIIRNEINDVWRVRHKDTGELATLTVFDEDVAPNGEAMQRLLGQAQLNSAYPGVMRTSCSSRGPRLVMLRDWIEGPTVADLIELHPNGLPQEDIRRIAAPALRTLHRIHTLRPPFIHGDIKPQHIIIEAQGQPCLINFDLELSSSQRDSGPAVVRSPHYVAPELIYGNGRISSAVDVYAFGIVLFEMATGKKPFDASHDLAWFDFLSAIQTQHIHSMPPWVADLRQGLSDDFEFLVQKAIEKDPTRRWASCEEMADFLESIIEPQPAPDAK